MNKTTHTPGPWTVRQDFVPSEHGTIEIYNDGNRWIASALGTHVGPETKEEARANAKLIAAAPDLLEALQEAQKALKENFPWPELHAKIQAAIDKAIN